MTTWEIYKVFKKSYDVLINLRMDSAIEKDNMSLFSECIGNVKSSIIALSSSSDIHKINDVVALPYQSPISDLIEKPWSSERKVSTLLSAFREQLEKINKNNYSLVSKIVFFLKEIALKILYLDFSLDSNCDLVIMQINRAIVLDAMDGKYVYSSELYELIENINRKMFLSYLRWSAEIIWAVAMLNYKTHNYQESIFFFREYISRFDEEQINKMGDSKNISPILRAKIYIGYSFEKDEHFDEAIKLFHEIETELDSDNELLIEIYHGLGHFYNEYAIFGKTDMNVEEKSQYISQARKYMLKALNSKADYYSCFGSLFHEYGDYNIADNIFRYASEQDEIKNSSELSSEMKFYIAQTLMVLEPQGDNQALADSDFKEFEKFCEKTYNYDGIVHARIFRAKLKMRNFSLFPTKKEILNEQQDTILELIQGLNQHALSVYASDSIKKEYNKVLSALYIFYYFTIGQHRDLNFAEIQYHMNTFVQGIYSQEKDFSEKNIQGVSTWVFEVKVNGVSLFGIGDYSFIEEEESIFNVAKDEYSSERFNVDHIVKNLSIKSFKDYLHSNKKPDTIMIIPSENTKDFFEKSDILKDINADDVIYILYSADLSTENWFQTIYKRKTGKGATLGQKYFAVKNIEDLLRISFCFRCFEILKKDMLASMPLFSLAPTHFSESYNYQLGESLDLLDIKKGETPPQVKQAILRSALEKQNQKYDQLYIESIHYKLKDGFLANKQCSCEDSLFACCFLAEDLESNENISKTISFVIKDEVFLKEHHLDKLFKLDVYYGYRALYNYVDVLTELSNKLGYDNVCTEECGDEPCHGCCEGSLRDFASDRSSEEKSIALCVIKLLSGILGDDIKKYTYRFRVIRRRPSPDADIFLFLKRPSLIDEGDCSKKKSASTIINGTIEESNIEMKNICKKDDMVRKENEKIMNKEKKTVFVTYCWTPKENQDKVFVLVDNLRARNLFAEQDVDIMQRERNIQKVMNIGLQYDKVVVVLTEEYKKRADEENGKTGVAYEAPIISAEMRENPRKFSFVSFKHLTPELRKRICPKYFKGINIIDLTSEDDLDGYNRLYSELFDIDLVDRKPVVDVDETTIVKKRHQA